jgi:hypothetical protein
LPPSSQSSSSNPPPSALAQQDPLRRLRASAACVGRAGFRKEMGLLYGLGPYQAMSKYVWPGVSNFLLFSGCYADSYGCRNSDVSVTLIEYVIHDLLYILG